MMFVLLRWLADEDENDVDFHCFLFVCSEPFSGVSHAALLRSTEGSVKRLSFQVII
jgi:hypothetical protein